MEYHIADSEYRFMQVVWEVAPVASGRLVALCSERLGWKKSTTYTVLKKMCVKGLLKNEKSLVTVVVPRAEVDHQTARQFVARVFGGSLPDFLAAFLGDGEAISPAEREALQRLLDAPED